MINVDTQTFHKVVDEAPYAVVKIGADWCPPCHDMDNGFLHVEKLFSDDVLFVSHDAGQGNAITAEYRISTIPTILYFSDGELADKTVGLVTEQTIKDRIEQLLEL